ncbi:MAG: YfhO family protein, partial [Bacteroidales bacterium]|nr:YfhO family protein [Bacteroidales bacterium]
YQELIDYHITPEIQYFFSNFTKSNQDISQMDKNGFSVLNMLNAKYIILPVEGGKTYPLLNPHAYGNAWFANHIEYVENANEEIERLKQVNPKETAIVNKEFKEKLNHITETKNDSLAQIKLTQYEPNHLVYKVSTPKETLALFSEIYYPQWRATLNGEPIEMGRANYVLRAITIPAGEHVLEMTFNPVSIKYTEIIAYCAIIILLGGFILIIIQKVTNRKKKR